MKYLNRILILFTLVLSSHLSAQFKYEPHILQSKLSLVETDFVKFEEDGMAIRPKNIGSYNYILPFRISQDLKKPKGYEFQTTVISLNNSNKYFGYKVFFQGGHEILVLFHSQGRYFVSYKPSSARESSTIIKWSDLETINKGANSSNSIGVKVDKKSIHFTMNGKPFHSILKKNLPELGMPTNAGIGTIALNIQGDGEYKVTAFTMNLEPEIRSIKYAKEDPSISLTLFNNEVNQEDYPTTQPVISADEKTLYFVRKLEHDRSEVITRKENFEWSTPEVMPHPINRENKHSAVESSNSDGTVIYSRGVYENGKHFYGLTQYKLGLDGNWIEGSKHRINNFKNLNRYLNYNLSNDEKHLLVVADMGDGFGNSDIHISFRQEDGTFSKPKNLGPSINSAANESASFLAPDNRTLYFSTAGLPGYGDNDIFMSKRLDDTWTNWSEPINLGTTINSVAWDSYFTTSASGNMSIIASIFGRKKSSLFYFELEASVKPDPVIVLSGTVTDAETNEPLLTTVRVKGLSSKEQSEMITNPSNGRYSKVLLKGEKYEIIAEKSGYYPISELVDLTTLDEFADIEKNLKLAPIKIGQVIRLNNIFFEFAKSALMDESFEELNRLVDLMKKNPNMKIQISGHTDGIGSEESNRKLSQDRSQSVVNYLVKNGIADSRLKAVGYGKSRPIATNETEEGRAINRRVEFEILE